MIKDFWSLGEVVVIVIIESVAVYHRQHLGHWNLPGSCDRFIVIFLRNLITGCCRHWNVAEFLQFRVWIIVDFVDLLDERELQFLPSMRLGDLWLINIVWAWTFLLSCRYTLFGVIDSICEELFVGIGSFRNHSIFWKLITSFWSLSGFSKTTWIVFLSICTAFAAKLVVHV